jgi:D-aminopeptidase
MGLPTPRPRLRQTGFRPEALLAPGPLNAITDVPGVRVGHAALAADDPGARTGVTVVLPHAGDVFEEKCPAAVWALNGSGECTGSLQINEWGVLETPVFLTGTPSVGRVYDAVLDWVMAHNPRVASGRAWVIPCVAECYDGWLNDARRHRAGAAEVAAALADASAGPVAEGCVGAGSGMICFGFKGGIGTASRRVADTPWHVGALALCNFGTREELVVAGVRLGRALADSPAAAARMGEEPPRGGSSGQGSCILVLATDAPLQHHGLRRLCKRGGLGIGRTGAAAHHGSGDIVIAFSTAGFTGHGATARGAPELWGQALTWLFHGAAEAAEEAVLNALFAAVDTTGQEGRTVAALPVEEAVACLRAHRPDRFGEPGAG